MDNLETPSPWTKLQELIRAHTNRLIWIGLFLAGNLTGWLAASSHHPRPAVKAPVAAAAPAKKAAAKQVAKKAPAPGKKAVAKKDAKADKKALAKKDAKKKAPQAIAGR